MARLYYVVSSATPDGRPIPASILFDVEWQNDEFEKETNGTEITNAILSKRSQRNIADKFEPPFDIVQGEMAGLPISWTLIHSSTFSVILPPGRYFFGFIRIAGSIGDGGRVAYQASAGFPPQDPTFNFEDEEVLGDYDFVDFIDDYFLDELSLVSGQTGNNFVELQDFINDSFGVITHFEIFLEYELIF